MKQDNFEHYAKICRDQRKIRDLKMKGEVWTVETELIYARDIYDLITAEECDELFELLAGLK